MFNQLDIIYISPLHLAHDSIYVNDIINDHNSVGLDCEYKVFCHDE